jgi:hypothetical protein
MCGAMLVPCWFHVVVFILFLKHPKDIDPPCLVIFESTLRTLTRLFCKGTIVVQCWYTFGTILMMIMMMMMMILAPCWLVGWGCASHTSVTRHRRLLDIVGYSTSSATQHRRLLNIVGYSTSSATQHRQPCPQSK